MFTREELNDAGLLDFRVFLIQVWAFLGLPRPTKAQLDIAYQLQHGEQRFILQAFRGIGKSWITVAFVLWTLLLDPDKKVMVVSASESLAQDFTKFCFQLIQGMPLLQHLEPVGEQRRSSEKFDVGPAKLAKDPSVKSVSITGQLTGSRADIIIADDVEVPRNSFTFSARERLAKLVEEFDSVIKPVPDTKIVFLGTPQHEASLYIRLEGRGYTLRIWPAEIPAKPERYGGRLAPYITRMIAQGLPAGTPVDPVRFPREELDKRRAGAGVAGYALQFMLDISPTSATKNPLKLRDLIVHDCDDTLAPVKIVWGREKEGRPTVIQALAAGGLEGDMYHGPAWLSSEMSEYTGTVMAIDPSGRGSDETAYAIVRFSHGLLYLVAVGGFKDGFGEPTLRALATLALRHRVNDIVVETNYGGGMFNQLLRPHLQRVGLDKAKAEGAEWDGKPAGRIDEEWDGWSKGQKELRICDTLEPVVLNHKLVVDRRVLEEDAEVQAETPQYSFVQQFTRMTRQKGALANEDRLEAVSMAVSFWTQRMNRDQDRALEQHKEAAIDAELKKFMNSIFQAGGAKQSQTWGNSRWN